MADVPWGIAFNCGLNGSGGQLGSQNNTVIEAATPLGTTGQVLENEGPVLGDYDSGIGNSGITLPTFTRQDQRNPDVPGSFTATASNFERIIADGFEIAFPLKGNGQTASDDPGEARPDAGLGVNDFGVDALIQMAGLTGANSTDTISGWTYDADISAKYGTCKLFINGLQYVFLDCVVENLSLPFTGGETTIATATIRPSSILDVLFPSEIDTPTVDYGNQSTLSAPVTQQAGFTWGLRGTSAGGYSDMTVEVANSVIEIPDSNQATGVRFGLESREITVNGTLYMDNADEAAKLYEWTQLNAQDAGDLVNATWQVGDLSPNVGPFTEMNAFAVACNGLQLSDFQYDKLGSAGAATINGRCTSDTAGQEFFLTFN
jgi:hypothetical protein